MPTETSVHGWRELWQKLLERLPQSDDPLEPEISAEVFVHNADGKQAAVTPPSPAPAGDRPISR